MAEHKYTDEETIKSLECCANADCVNCPRWSEEWYSGMCADFLPSVLDLFKRQKAKVALEVIGEVEKMARDYIDGIMLLDPQNTYCFGGINAFENVIKFLAELKKKYTA